MVTIVIDYDNDKIRVQDDDKEVATHSFTKGLHGIGELIEDIIQTIGDFPDKYISVRKQSDGKLTTILEV